MKFIVFGLFLTACTNINGYSGKESTDSASLEEQEENQTEITVEISRTISAMHFQKIARTSMNPEL